MIMEQLLKDLKGLGYELQYYGPLEAWKVDDFIAGINDFLPAAFVEFVFRHGFIFSVGTTLEGEGLCVNFYKMLS